MKKLLPFTFIILFPYAVVFLICSILNESLMKYVFHNNIFLGLLYLCIFLLIAFISSIVICVNTLTHKRDAVEIAKINMAIKIVQIPAYVLIFVAGLACVLTIFTIGISFILMILDCASIILSGLIGVSAVRRNHVEGSLSGKEMVVHSILQFLFCLDIISAIIVFKKAKRRISKK